GDFSVKELRSVGIGTGVSVGQAPWNIELEIRTKLIFNLVARAAGAVSQRIASLDHEVGDHAMKNSSVIERNPMLHLAGFGIAPVARARGQAYEVRDRVGRLIRKKGASHLSCSGINYRDRFCAGCCSRGSSSRLLRLGDLGLTRF